jgi:hypothetical protein
LGDGEVGAQAGNPAGGQTTTFAGSKERLRKQSVVSQKSVDSPDRPTSKQAGGQTAGGEAADTSPGPSVKPRDPEDTDPTPLLLAAGAAVPAVLLHAPDGAGVTVGELAAQAVVKALPAASLTTNKVPALFGGWVVESAAAGPPILLAMIPSSTGEAEPFPLPVNPLTDVITHWAAAVPAGVEQVADALRGGSAVPASSANLFYQFARVDAAATFHDALGRFINECAMLTPSIVPENHSPAHARAWAVTAAVVLGDLALAAYVRRRRRLNSGQYPRADFSGPMTAVFSIERVRDRFMLAAGGIDDATMDRPCLS